MNVEDNIDDEKINEIFRYYNFEEIFFYYKLMLEKIDDEDLTTKDDMW